jgi:hypothetical protein
MPEKWRHFSDLLAKKTSPILPMVIARPIFVLIMMACCVCSAARDDPSMGSAVRLDSYPQARCLDGSPMLYFVSDGFDTGTDKWVLWYEDGEICGSADECVSMSKTDQGSTKSDPDSTRFQYAYLSAQPDHNPIMFNWHKVSALLFRGRSRKHI